MKTNNNSRKFPDTSKSFHEAWEELNRRHEMEVNGLKGYILYLQERQRQAYLTMHDEKLSVNDKLLEIKKIFDKAEKDCDPSRINVNPETGEIGIDLETEIPGPAKAQDEDSGYTDTQKEFFHRLLRESLYYVREAIFEYNNGKTSLDSAYYVVKSNDIIDGYVCLLDEEKYSMTCLCEEYEKMLYAIDEIHGINFEETYPYHTFAKCKCVDGETFQNEADTKKIYAVQEALELAFQCAEIHNV